MTSSWKIAISGACIALMAGASVAWWAHREKAIKWKKLSEAASETRARAEQGDATAQANLGYMYSHSQGIPQDYSEALRWYRRAAEQENAKGQYGLGNMYYHGQGIAQDYAQALRWYRKAADQGDPKAENGLAFMYLLGQAVPQDYTEASRWYRKAADQDYARAQYNLGNRYWYGQGVPQDRVEAERWYHKAAAQGDDYAQRALGLRGPGLTGWRTVSLLAMLLGCWVALNGSLSPQRSVRHQQPRALAMAGVCGLASIGLSLYWDFSVFPSVSAVSALHFATNLAAGITVAMLISVFGPKRAKIVLGISGILLIVNDLIMISLIVISRHDVTRFVTTSLGFSSVNGLLIGIAVPSAIFLWLEATKRARDKTAAG